MRYFDVLRRVRIDNTILKGGKVVCQLSVTGISSQYIYADCTFHLIVTSLKVITVLQPLDNYPNLSIHLSIPMSRQNLTIAQAARSLGVSSRTVRRFIKSGKVNAELVPGPFGEEYRILELPADLHKPKPVDNTPGQPPIQTLSQPSVQTPIQSPIQSMDTIIRELHERNLTLAAQLGAATERIRNLENQVRLLTTTKRQPWWKRLFGRKYYTEP